MIDAIEVALANEVEFSTEFESCNVFEINIPTEMVYTNDNQSCDCAHLDFVLCQRDFRLCHPRVVRPGSDKLTGYLTSLPEGKRRDLGFIISSDIFSSGISMIIELKKDYFLIE